MACIYKYKGKSYATKDLLVQALKRGTRSPEVNKVFDAAITFLENYGFEVNEAEGLLIDLAAKRIDLNKGNPKQLSRALAESLSEMLSYSDFFYKIEGQVKNTRRYRRLITKHKARTGKFDRNTKRQAVKDIFKDLLENGFNEVISKELKIEPSLWSQVMSFIEGLLSSFQNVDFKAVEAEINTIVDNTFRNENFIRLTDKEGYEQVDFQKAFDQNAIAKEIMTEVGTDNRIMLTGSIAYATQGTVYRPMDTVVHDLDFVSSATPKENDALLKNSFPDAIKVYEFNNTYDTTTYIVPPKGYRVSNMKRREGGQKIIYYELIDESGEVAGTYTLNYDVLPGGKITNESEVKQGKEAMLVDFFTGDVPNKRSFKHDFKGTKGKNFSVNLAHYASPFEAKLDYSRFKDIWDYNRFKPNMKAETKLENRMIGILEALNIDVISMDEYEKYYEQKYGKKLNAQGVADMLKNVVAVKDGKRDIETLPEETAHFIIYALQKDPKVQQMLSEVHKTDTWARESEVYMKDYNNDEQKVRMEILGKMLGDALIKQADIKETRGWNSLLRSLWRSFLRKMNLLSTNQQLMDEVDRIAEEGLSDVTRIRKGLEEQIATEKDVFKQIDPKNFENSKILDAMGKELEQAKEIINRKVYSYRNRGVKGFTQKESKLYAELLKASKEKRTTEGIVNFIAYAEKDGKNILDRLDETTESFAQGAYNEEFNELSRLLRDMNTYMTAYKPLVDTLMADVARDKRRLDGQEQNMENHDELFAALQNISNAISEMNNSYDKYSKNIFISMFRPFLEKRFSTDEQIEEELERLMAKTESVDNDIWFLRRWGDSMAESRMDLLMLTDRFVKEYIEKSDLETDEGIRDLIDLDEDLRDAGIDNTEFMYETYKGLHTGNIVTKYNTAKFEEAKDKFFDELNDKYGLPSGRNPKAVAERNYMKTQLGAMEYKDYNEEIKEWFAENTVAHPEWETVSDEKYEAIRKHIIPFKKDRDTIDHFKARYPDVWKAKLKVEHPRLFKRENTVESAHLDWESQRRITYNNGNTSYRKELAVPNNKYLNPQYDEIMGNDAMRTYYNGVLELRSASMSHMHEKMSTSMLAPQVRKDLVERLQGDNKRETLKETMRDIFLEREDDTDFGNTMLDENDKRIQSVPIYYMNKLGNMSDLSTDFTSSMAMFLNMANKNRNMNNIIDIIEVGADIMEKRDIKNGSRGMITKGISVGKEGVKRAQKETTGGEAFKRYRDFVDMVMYGEMKNDEGYVEIMGNKISVAKSIDALNTYTAMNNLALNIFAGFQNIMYGNLMIEEERIAGEFVKGEDLSYARNQYYNIVDGIGGLLGDVGKTRSSNKLRLFYETFDVLQDMDSRTKELNVDRSRFGKQFDRSAVFFINHAGEHQMQGRMALALAHNFKLKDKSGNLVPLYEAYEVVNHRLKLREGLTKEDGTEFTQKDLIAFKIRMKAINQRLHGVYNMTDRAAIQKKAVGRLVMLFRKWMKPGFNRRFDRPYYNYSLNSDVEGTYYSTYRFFSQLRAEMKKDQGMIASLNGSWKGLTPRQQANVFRTISEVSFFLLAMGLGSILLNISGDDEEDWALNMAAYQMLRLSTEIGIYIPGWNATEFLEIATSPAAAMNQIGYMMDIFDILNPIDAVLFDEPLVPRYKSGKNKDRTRFSVWMQRSVPFWDTVDDWWHPEDKLNYLAR